MATATAEIMAHLPMARTLTLRFGQGRNSLRRYCWTCSGSMINVTDRKRTFWTLSLRVSRSMDFICEAFDQMQRAFDLNGFNDHQLHCVLRFDSGAGPDAAILRRAAIASIEAIPILGTRYADGAKPRWVSLDPESCARAFVVAPTETDFETVLVARADEDCGPQVRVCLLDGRRSAVALTLNHMICDAAGFKSYIYFLCAIYTRLLADPAYRPNPVAGDRSIRRVLERFRLGVKLKSLFLQSGDNNQSGDRRFPISEGEVDEPIILTRRLARARTAAIRDYGRANGATLNDLALTALYRCLFRLLDLRPGAELTIPVMVDMRRYLADGDEFTALTNLSSTVVTQLRREPEEAFPRTLGRVKAEMDEKKGGDIGLNAFVKLDLLYRLMRRSDRQPQAADRTQEPTHLHDQYRRAGRGAPVLRRSAPDRRLSVRLDQVQALFPTRHEFLPG